MQKRNPDEERATLLIIDDDPGMRAMPKDFPEREGCRVITEEALT